MSTLHEDPRPTGPATTAQPAASPSPGALTVGKYHGLGNDFLVAIDPAVELDAAAARRLCDRHTGIGADGLIESRTGKQGKQGEQGKQGLDGPTLTFRLWNADGSEAEMSGNGMRCLAHAALDAGVAGVSVGVPFDVATPAGTKEVVIERAGATVWSRVDMGRVTVEGEAERCNVGHGQLYVEVGNPHLVVAGADPSTVDVAALGPALSAGTPGGLNVEFATLGPGPDEVTMRVWERGVGETRACGTGSCAAAAAFRHWGRVGRRVTVHQPGGAVSVDLGDDGTVRLAGPSELIASCHVPAGPGRRVA